MRLLIVQGYRGYINPDADYTAKELNSRSGGGLVMNGLVAAATRNGWAAKAVAGGPGFLARCRDHFKPDLLIHYTQASIAFDPCQSIVIHHGSSVRDKRMAELRDGTFRQKLSALRRYQDEKPNIPRWMHTVSLSYEDAIRYGFTYHPLPLDEALPILRHPNREPYYFLPGSFESSNTIAGLRFFEKRVLPKLPKWLSFYAAGRGKLKYYPWLNNLGFLGEAPLRSQYSTCWAVLIPSPLGGIQYTRVVDAFRHGVPVIANAALKRAMPELEHGVNCLLPRNSHEWAQALNWTPKELHGLSTRALRLFREKLTSEHFLQAVAWEKQPDTRLSESLLLGS